MNWYKKTALSGVWFAYVHAESEEEVRELHDTDLQLLPHLAHQYPGAYEVEQMPPDFVPPEPLDALQRGDLAAFEEALIRLPYPDEQRLTTPILQATLKADGTLYLKGAALHEGVSKQEVQELTRFLMEHVVVPPRLPVSDFEDFTPMLVDLTEEGEDGNK